MNSNSEIAVLFDIPPEQTLNSVNTQVHHPTLSTPVHTPKPLQTIPIPPFTLHPNQIAGTTLLVNQSWKNWHYNLYNTY